MRSMPGLGRLVGRAGALMVLAGVVALVAFFVRGDEDGGFLYGMYAVLALGGFVVMWLGGRLENPGTKELRDRRVESSGPMIDRYVEGDHVIDLDGRVSPVFTFEVGGISVTLRQGHATAGSTDRWDVDKSFRRASVTSDASGGDATATKRPGDPKRWRIDDGFSAFELTTTKRKQNKRVNASERRRTWTRQGDLTYPDGAADPIGSVELRYDRVENRTGLSSKDLLGTFTGHVRFAVPVSVPVAVLALRITAGSWARMAPRTGEWHDSGSTGA